MFARDWAQGPPQALAPEALQRYEGPTGSFKYAAEQNPIAMMHPAIQALFHYMPKQDEQSLNPNFIEDPTTGARFATYGRQLLPSGTNPDRTRELAREMRALPLLGQDDKPVEGSHLVILPDGKAKVVKGNLPRIKTGNGLLNDQVGFTGTPEQYKAWIESSSQTNAPASAQSTDSAKGSVVMTDRNGVRVRVPSSQVEEMIKKGYK